MIDVNELNRYYVGTVMPVLVNAGGVFLELGEDIKTLLYKVDDNTYVDVNRKQIVQVIGEENIISSRFVLSRDSLRPIMGEEDIVDNSSFEARLSFKSTDYIKFK